MPDFGIYPALQSQLPDWGAHAAQVQQLTQNNQLMPLRVQGLEQSLKAGEESIKGSQIQNQLSEIQLKAAKTVQNNELLARAAQLGTDPESWDRNFQKLADEGVENADQYVGRWSRELQDQTAKTYGAAVQAGRSALAGAPGGGGGGAGNAFSGGGGVNPIGDATQIAQLPTEKLTEASQKLNMLNGVLNTLTLDNYDLELQRLEGIMPGISQMVGERPATAEELNQRVAQWRENLRDDTELVAAQLAQRATTGVSTIVPPTYDTAGNSIFATDPYNPDPAKRSPVEVAKGSVAPQEQLVGYDDQGFPIFHDMRGAEEGGDPDRKGKYPVTRGRYDPSGSGAGGTVVERLYAAELGRLEEEGYDVEDPEVQRMALERARYRQETRPATESDSIAKATDAANRSGWPPSDPAWQQIYDRTLREFEGARQRQERARPQPRRSGDPGPGPSSEVSPPGGRRAPVAEPWGKAYTPKLGGDQPFAVPPGAQTATNAAGVKVYWNGRSWVPVR